MAARSKEFCKVAWLSGSGLGFPVLMCQLAYETGEGRWRDATATPNWSLMVFLVLWSSSRAYSRRSRRRPRLSISGYANKASGPRAAGLLHCLVTHTPPIHHPRAGERAELHTPCRLTHGTRSRRSRSLARSHMPKAGRQLMVANT